MNEKQLQQPKRWLVPYPEKKALTGHPCQDACNGNQKMGQLLHYFLCEASWELERQELDESCKVVKFTRSHEHILKRVHISEKSLIHFLKQFNAWNFIVSEQYGKEFTVQAEPIQKAMYTPVFTKKMRRKSCTSTSENTTTSSEPSEVIESCKVYFLHEKVEALEEVQLYNITLEARIQALSEALEQESCKVVELQEKVEAGKLYNFTLSAWIDAVSDALKIPSPIIDSVIDRDIRDSERESKGEQSDTATSASSLPFDASPSLDNETQSQSFSLANSNTPLEGESDDLVATGTLPDPGPARSALDRGWQAVGEIPDGKEQEIARTCDTCGRPQTQADCPWCMTTRLPAIPKTPFLPSAFEPGRSGGPTPGAPASLPGGASHEQNRDAFPPRSVAVEADSGCTAPQVPPGVAPPRTMRATVVSPDLPTVKPKPARRKKGELDEVTQKRVESVIAYLDALKQEVMEDPETHYKPSLTDIESVVKTLLPQNPTEKRVRLVFFDMWNETDRDGNHFWRKHMQIHNVCKQYEGRIMGLEGKDKQDGRGNAQAPISSLPTSRGQQWRSSFDDPDYDMSAEFYPGTVAR